MPAVGMVKKVLFSKQVLEPLLLTIPTIVQTARNVYDDYRKRSTKSSAPVPLEELERRVSEQALLTSELAARLEDTARALRLLFYRALVAIWVAIAALVLAAAGLVLTLAR